MRRRVRGVLRYTVFDWCFIGAQAYHDLSFFFDGKRARLHLLVLRVSRSFHLQSAGLPVARHIQAWSSFFLLT